MILSRSVAAAGLLMLLVSSQMAASEPIAKNSWRGITPLHSSSEDVARTIGTEADSAEAMLSGPYKVEGGEVTFSYLTASLAKIYRAPRSMVGKVFTIYFKRTSRCRAATCRWDRASSGASKSGSHLLLLR